MSGYVPYGPGSCYAQGIGSSSAQNMGSTSNNADYGRQQRSIGHRRRRSELVGYKFPEHKSERALERETEKGSRQELLKYAGPDDGPYPSFIRPVPRLDFWAESNVVHWDPYHPERTINDENYTLTSLEFTHLELPPVVSPIPSFQLLGMTGEVAPSQDSLKATSSQGFDTRTSSFVNLPIVESPRPTKSRAFVTFHNGRFRVRNCFSFHMSRKKVTRIIYSGMGIMIVSIIISSVIYHTATLDGSMKIAVISWIGGSVFALVLLLIYNNARSSRLQECGDNLGYDKDWTQLGDMTDPLPAPSRVRLHDNGVLYRAHAGGQLPSLTHVSSAYPKPLKTVSKSESKLGWLSKSISKLKASTNAVERDQAIRCGCIASRQPCLSRLSVKSQNSVGSASTQYSDGNDIGYTGNTSLALQQGQASSMPNFNFPLHRRSGNKGEVGYGSGLPPRDHWCREPCGSMSNLRQDHYGNADPGPSGEASYEVVNGGKVLKCSSSLAARFNELTPITERSGEAPSPRSLLLSPPPRAVQSPSCPREVVLSLPPRAHIPRTGSNFF